MSFRKDEDGGVEGVSEMGSGKGGVEGSRRREDVSTFEASSV